MQTKTIFAMPNPYSALDAKGRLSGGCQMAGAYRGDPSVGAKMVLVDGTFNDRQDEIGRAADEGKMATPIVPSILFSRSERVWEFSSDPVQLEVTPEAAAFYEARFKDSNGSPPCLMRAKDANDTCLVALAVQRLDAIEKHRASYNAEPPVNFWKKQFDLDADIADLMKIVEEKRKVDAKTSGDAAKKASEQADTDAKVAADKKVADRKKMLEDARKAMLGAAPAPAKKSLTNPASSEK